MAPGIKLTRGSAELDLNAAPFAVTRDFTPPSPDTSYNIGRGTSANDMAGGSVISSRANNRQFSFEVEILAKNASEASLDVRKLLSFVRTRSSDPLYIEYRENTDIPIPLWGQFGAPLRMEVVTIDVGQISDDYIQSMGYGFSVTISAEIKPFAVGLKQKLINASGGILEDDYGTVDGAARGLAIFEGTTNKMTNPVFGHATYNNGWTTDATLIVSKNVNSSFCLPGLLQSTKVISISEGSFYQSINVGNTNAHSFSAYIMLPDGGTPTSSDMRIRYNSAQSTKFQSLGSGLWLAYSDNIAGVASAVPTGIVVYASRTIYLLGFQTEEKAYHTPLCYGDLLGNSWSGTMHASTSARVASILSATRTDEIIDIAQGAVSVVWKPYYSNTFATAEMFFSLTDSTAATYTLRGYFEPAGDNFILYDGTNTIQTAAQAFNAGDTLYLTFVWGPSGLAIYKNGVSVASGATFTVPGAANIVKLFIGNQNGGPIVNGTFIGFDIYPTQLTAAQALAIYNAQTAIISADGRVSSIPWLWTKDGDGIVDNCDDATRDNWCVAGGIPGNIDAETIFDMRLSSNLSSIGNLYLSNFHTSAFINPSAFLTIDLSGVADANSSGGAHIAPTTDYMAGQGQNLLCLLEMSNREICSVSRAKTDINTVSFASYISAGYKTLTSDYISAGMSTTDFTTLVAKTITLPNYSIINQGDRVVGTPSIGIVFIASSAVNIYVDFVSVLFRPIMKINGGAVTKDGIYTTNGKVTDYIVSSNIIANSDPNFSGDIVELIPNKYNILLSFLGSATVVHTITRTITYAAVKITPRYVLL